jgi:hypothetical protein
METKPLIMLIRGEFLMTPGLRAARISTPPALEAIAPVNSSRLVMNRPIIGLGRSRGGLSSKIQLATEQGHKAMSLMITAGRRGDCPQFIPVMERIRIARVGRGRPRGRPDRVLADKAYSARGNRACLLRRRLRYEAATHVAVIDI